jgi:hypothetical protein
MTTSIFRTAFLIAALASLVVMMCGCAEESYPLAGVSGKITKAGKPVSGASVYFQPIASEGFNAGPGSFGITDVEGHYELKTQRKKEHGAVVGRHRVIVHLPLPPNISEEEAISASLLSPLRFRDGSTQLEVRSDGPNSADFDLDGA